MWAAYAFVGLTASDGMGGVDVGRGLALYFSEDQPGEFVDRHTARVVRRMVPWLLGEDNRIRAELRERERGVTGG